MVCSAVSSKPLPQRAQSGMFARPALKPKLRRGNAFRVSHQVSETLKLFKKPEPGAQFQWERSSSPVQLCRSRSPPLVPDTVPSEAVKGHWTLKGYEGPCGIRWQMVFRPSAYVDLRPLGLTWGEEKSYSPFVSTLRLLTRIGPSMQVFEQACGSPDQAYPEPHCAYTECRPVYLPSAFDIPRVIWWGIVAAPADEP